MEEKVMKYLLLFITLLVSCSIINKTPSFSFHEKMDKDGMAIYHSDVLDVTLLFRNRPSVCEWKDKSLSEFCEWYMTSDTLILSDTKVIISQDDSIVSYSINSGFSHCDKGCEMIEIGLIHERRFLIQEDKLIGISYDFPDETFIKDILYEGKREAIVFQLIN